MPPLPGPGGGRDLPAPRRPVVLFEQESPPGKHLLFKEPEQRATTNGSEVTESRLWIYRRLLLLTPFALSAILVLGGPLRSLLSGEFNGAADFYVFYSGAELFDSGRYAELWDLDALGGVIGRDDPNLWYAYAPFYARAWVPLTSLTIDQAWILWTIAGVASILTAVRVVAGRWTWWLTLLAIISLPGAANFQLGQNVAFAALLVAASFALVVNDRQVLGGIVLGLMAYKPQLAIGIGLWWLLDRRYRAAAWSALGTVAVIVGTSWVLDPSAWSAYRNLLPDLSRVRGQPLQVSLAGFVDLALPDWTVGRTAGVVIGLLVLGAFGWWVTRRERPSDIAFAAAIAVTLLAAPYVLIYDYLILLAPIVVLLRRRDLERMWVPAIVLSWTVFLTYLVRSRIDDWLGFQIQAAPIALGIVLLLLMRRHEEMRLAA